MRNSPRSRPGDSRTESPELTELYRLAEEAAVPVFWYRLDCPAESAVVELGPGRTAIALDPLKFQGPGDEKYKLAHELGHSLTGALYRADTPLDERGRCEQRADRWAIEVLLPFGALQGALASGRRTLQELAEFFELPPALIEKAIAYYTGPKGMELAAPVF